jgi:hypothetical protein
LSGEAELTQYLFHTMKNQHYFCKHCGVRAFGVGTETPISKMYGVNLGCLEGVSEEELFLSGAFLTRTTNYSSALLREWRRCVGPVKRLRGLKRTARKTYRQILPSDAFSLSTTREQPLRLIKLDVPPDHRQVR